jgi:hypothetical protein
MSKVKLTKTLPTDRIGFAKQQDIIKAYLAAYEKVGSTSVSNEDVAQLVGMKATTVSMLNAFLVDVGFIIRSESGKYTPSGDLLSFSKALHFDPANAWAKLAPLLSKTWFAQEIIARGKLKELEETEALTCLAVCSNADKDQSAQLKMLLDYLAVVGLVVRDGGKVKLPGPKGAPLVDLKNNSGNDQKKHKEQEGGDDPDPPDSYTLALGSGRKVVVQAPATITGRELKRIQAWLALQLIVSDESEGQNMGGAPQE